jgi:hypothetical protein
MSRSSLIDQESMKFPRDRFIMKFIVKAEREGGCARRVSQGISSEIWPRNATKQTPLRSLLEQKFILKRSLSFIFFVASIASAQGDSLVEPVHRGESISQSTRQADTLYQSPLRSDSAVQPTRAPQYEPIPREIDRPSSKKPADISLALASNPGRLATYGVRVDYGIRYEKSRLSLIGAFGIGYTGATRVMRMNAGGGVCFSQTFLSIGRLFALASGCGLGFWTIRDYCPDPVYESYDNLNATPAKKTGAFVQNEWFLLNTRAEFTVGIVRCFGNADLLMSPRRFTPSLGVGMFFPLSGGEAGGLRNGKP